MTISFQSVMKRGAVSTTGRGPADGSADAPEVRGAESPSTVKRLYVRAGSPWRLV